MSISTDAILDARQPESWLGAPVQCFEGTLDEIRHRIPSFGRVPFSVEIGPYQISGEHPNLDVVVRLPLKPGEHPVPLGVVSKTYQLVQHTEVLGWIAAALEDAKVSPDAVTVRLQITEYGERMAVHVLMPQEERFRFDVQPGDSVGLQLYCLNSVEGSTRFMAVMGWLRFVCSNGLVSGRSVSRLRRIHTGDLRGEEVEGVLRATLKSTWDSRSLFSKWMKARVAEPALAKWVDGPLLKSWGMWAATRAYHIVRRGSDVVPADRFDRGNPSSRSVKVVERVPGAGLEPSAFAAAQALSWLAGQRREVPEQMERLAQIPRLVERLVAMI